MSLRIEAVQTKRDASAFLDLPYRLYRGHPVWVPPLRVAEAETFDPRKNPFFQHAEVQHFLARRDDRVVGRIAAIENRLHNETHPDGAGFFGFFDAESDPEAVEGLVDAARVWVKERGLTLMRGPMNYSTNDSCAVLVDGFEHRPTILMPYNRPDYDTLLKGAGLQGAKDLLAFWLASENPLSERLLRVIARLQARSKVTLRRIDLSDIGGEIGRLKDVYNRCWADNYGFVPATEEEFQHASKQLKMLLEPYLSSVAEIDGKPVGLALVIRDLNHLLANTNGRLLPKALFRILFRMKSIPRVRVIALGVVPEVRGRGINEMMFVRAFQRSGEMGYDGGEAGWILEDNERMKSPIISAGGVPYKRYRIYEMAT